MRRTLLLMLAVLAVACAAQGAAPPDALAVCNSLTHPNVQVSNDPNQAGAVVNYSAPTVNPAS